MIIHHRTQEFAFSILDTFKPSTEASITLKVMTCLDLRGNIVMVASALPYRIPQA
jgi:hypothetical protein